MRPEPVIPGLTPAGCFDILAPRLADVLVPAARHSAIHAAAALLPPVPRLALEIRLGQSDAAVDLHQMITRQEGDPQIALRYLNTMKADGDRAGVALTDFLRGWIADEDGAQGWFDPLYLEWDMAPDGGLRHVPALFLASDLRSDDLGTRTRRRGILRQTVARLRGADEAGVPDPLFDVAEGAVSISHIGVMSGRGDVLRVNYKNITPAVLPGVLSLIGWPGDIRHLQGHFATLVDAADRVAVGIDLVDGHVWPSIGFEIFCDHPLPSGRWDRILDHLCAHGLCSTEKRAALAGIEASLSVGDDGQSWPIAWMLPTLRGPEDAYPVVRCHVSHLKLAIGADGAGQAKAYVAAEHHWRRGFGRPAAAAPPAGLTTRPRASAAAATADATAFLLRVRQQNGIWGDFNRINGGCNNWVTGVAALALAETGGADALAAASEALDVLSRRQQASGGWGHNETAPVDTDTTASIIKALEAIGSGESPVAAAARRCLRDHLTGSGFQTYGAATRIRFATADVSDAGWRVPHTCVIANCAALLPDQLIPVLRRSQAPDGSWTPYWWRTSAYPTALATEALAMHGDAVAVERAVTWAKAQATAALSPFCAAAIARILIAGGRHDDAGRILAGLLRTQLSDGGWPVGADMIWPPSNLMPGQVKNHTDVIDVPDDRRVFTTAGVLLAFAAARRSTPAAGA